ncbi:MAG: hypothetical protein H0T79_03075, partial [Deltaproteobacteria bacterium]|nr:hypothetical protein [Deltaproteobacteria bacterium]
MRLPFFVLAVAACTPEVAPQAPCGDEGICGGDEVCDRSPAAPTCLPAADDLDGDGLANAEDLCPQLAGAAQFDEDNDGIGDACDRCPIAPPRDTPDTDGDGVDGICDPEPDLAGNRIVTFTGFRETPANWTIPAGWQVVGGEVVATIPGVGTDLFVTPIVGSNRLAIEASYRIDSFDATASPSITLVARDRRPAGSTTLACGVKKNGT